MRQRNVTGGPLVLPTLDPPLEAEVNAVIDPPDDLGCLPGFELVDPDDAPPVVPPAEQPADPAPAAEQKPKPTKRASAAAATDNAGEA